MTRIAIIGGGISGLSAAYFLRREKPELEVTVLEQSPQLGGKLGVSTPQGYTVDWAANGFLTNVTETLELAKDLGLEDELEPASEAAKYRFLYKDGELKPLPLSPPTFLTSDLLTPVGKVRAALEPLLGRHVEDEETVYTFLKRHFGKQMADVFAGPFVLGITSGDAKELSLDALFPRFRALEREHGSLIRGMIAAQKRAKAEDKPKSRLTSFRSGGINRLIHALGEVLGERVRLGVGVKEVKPHAGRYQLTLSSGETLNAEGVVFATPAYVTADLIRPLAPLASAELEQIPYADVQVFGLGYDRADVLDSLAGFGFLVPRGEGLRVLGVLYGSSIFPSQAPEGKVLLRVIAGGSVDPEFAQLSEAEALEVIQRDLEVSLGITAEPEMVAHIPWAKGIPQYELGHGVRVSTIMQEVAAQPGLHLTGNAYYGVGVNDCVRDAKRVVDEVLKVTREKF